jgi:acetyltransferase-like isoleucine patch superfamily enzyme
MLDAVSRMTRALGKGSVGAYALVTRVRARAFSTMVSGAFERFGPRSVLQPPIRLGGERWIAIGADVFVGAGSYLQVLYSDTAHGHLEIGDGTSMTGNCVLSAAGSITLGRKVLLARNVYIADHRHRFDDPGVAIMDQGVEQVEPIVIGDGAWLGQNVVVGPGVTIGAGAVIGANSVVLSDVPARSVAVGAPARVVRTLDPAEVHA